jgi:hypothetical protein
MQNSSTLRLHLIGYLCRLDFLILGFQNSRDNASYLTNQLTRLVVG